MYFTTSLNTVHFVRHALRFFHHIYNSPLFSVENYFSSVRPPFVLKSRQSRPHRTKRTPKANVKQTIVTRNIAITMRRENAYHHGLLSDSPSLGVCIARKKMAIPRTVENSDQIRVFVIDGATSFPYHYHRFRRRHYRKTKGARKR